MVPNIVTLQLGLTVTQMSPALLLVRVSSASAEDVGCQEEEGGYHPRAGGAAAPSGSRKPEGAPIGRQNPRVPQSLSYKNAYISGALLSYAPSPISTRFHSAPALAASLAKPLVDHVHQIFQSYRVHKIMLIYKSVSGSSRPGNFELRGLDSPVRVVFKFPVRAGERYTGQEWMKLVCDTVSDVVVWMRIGFFVALDLTPTPGLPFSTGEYAY